MVCLSTRALPPNIQLFFGGFDNQTVQGYENVIVSLWFNSLDGMTMGQYWNNKHSKVAGATEASSGVFQYPSNHQNATCEERLA